MPNEALCFDENGEAIWSTVVVVMPRKNGKTELLAAVALYRLLTNDGSPEILLAAASDKQAGRLFDAAASFVRRSPGLAKLLRVRSSETGILYGVHIPSGTLPALVLGELVLQPVLVTRAVLARRALGPRSLPDLASAVETSIREPNASTKVTIAS
jgi:hypothetical protein